MKDPLINTLDIVNVLKRNSASFHPVVAFNPLKDKLKLIDFTTDNHSLTKEIFEDTRLFEKYIMHHVQLAEASYGIGGYGELRTVYSRSKVFDAPNPWEEPRRIHLGTDIWGKAGTPVFAPRGGMVQNLVFNKQFGT